MTSLQTVKKIHVLQIVGDPVGGIRKHVHSIVNGLDPALFTQSYAYSTTMQDAKFQQEIGALRSCLTGEAPLNIRKRPHPSDGLNVWKIIRYVKRNKVDVIHGHGAKAGLYARLVAGFCGIKAVYTPHGGMVHNMFSKWEDKLYIAIEKWLAKKTDFFLFESKYTADSFQSKVVKLPAQRWMVNYNGIAEVDLEAVALRSKAAGYGLDSSDVLQVGIFAMLRSQKGQIFAIRAMPHLIASTNKKVMLNLFGDGPDREELQREINRLGIGENIKFHGDVSDPEAHMFAMDVILIPSLFESFGYVAIEAMALGKLVIASRVGGLTEIVDDHTGSLVTPGSEMEIAATLNHYAANSVMMVELAEKGRQKCSISFNLNNMLEKIEKIYGDLVVLKCI